jgi:hypothetical protein
MTITGRKQSLINRVFLKLIYAAGALTILCVAALWLLWPGPREPVLEQDAETAETAAVSTAAEMAVELPALKLPDRVLLDAPFFPQAPLARWSDPRQQDGCEEAALLMVHLWLTGQTMTAEQAEQEIIRLSEYEALRYGGFVDRSITDVCALFTDYYHHKAYIRRDVSAEDIRETLARGNLVIVPTNGRILDNPNYTAPGPITHMLLVTGYDDETGQFITNDPGTRNGRGFVFSYERLIAAIYDYPTGGHVEYRPTGTVMMVVEKP